MGAILRLAITLMAGLGAGAVLDKVAADKVPNYTPALSQGMKDEAGNFSPMKIVWFVAAAVAGTILVKWIGKKLNIKILK